MDSESCNQNESDKMVEILKNKLYFAVIRGLSGKKIKSTADALYFSIDDEFVYQNYYFDFGPYNISYLYKYCMKLNKYLQYAQGQKRVVHCTSTNAEKKVNAAYLIGCYCIIYLKIHPANVTKLLQKAGPFKQFMDASQIPCPYTVKLEFCFNAIAKAMAFNFFSFNDFDVMEYDMYEKLQFGDMNWLVPRKFLAFIGPISNEFLNGHPPDYYIKYFLKNDIKTVIRLNNKMYDSKVFRNAGINHVDLIYPDGSTPSRNILLKFLQIAESAPAAIAVHCKAGLGRTGSLIGAYIVKHYKMTAKEAIAWMRICRPGSVIGQQQVWLEKLEPWLWKCGNQFRCRHYGDGDKIPRHKFGIYSKVWPVERTRILREVKRNYLSQYSASDPEHLAQNEQRFGSVKSKTPYQRFRTKNNRESSRYEDISDFLTSIYNLENTKRTANRTLPNIRVLDINERKRPILTGRRAAGSRRAAGESINVTPSQPKVSNARSTNFDFRGDTLPTNVNAHRKEHFSSAIFPMSSRIGYSLKVDNDTDTSGYVNSYMEERAKKKAYSNRVAQATQGDKLNEKKIRKSGRIIGTPKESVLDQKVFMDQKNFTATNKHKYL